MVHVYEVQRDQIRSFMLAGKCECTITTQKGQYTYKIIRADTSYSMYFVRVCTSYEEYVYAGYIVFNRDGSVVFRKGDKGKFNDNAPSILALLYTLRHAKDNTLPDFIKVWHFNKCGKCGRKLTDAKSIQRGIGPECMKMVSDVTVYAPTKPPVQAKKIADKPKAAPKQEYVQLSMFPQLSYSREG